ncbi:lantibiotic dehydratase [Streptomyces sp. NPDC050161]|uniref:lantibiotic dehydratase n=1 Tax=Streptomyces sp. NPDC050161 TaxID=3365604 RepID=UPI003793C754
MAQQQSAYSCAGFALLRAPVLPASRAQWTGGPGTEDPTATAATEPNPAQLIGYLREMAADPVMREAVAVSSPSLTHRWNEVLDGERRTRRRDLVRVARALTAYRIRMATRPTPFGLMAGVAMARISQGTQAEEGGVAGSRGRAASAAAGRGAGPTGAKVRFGSRHRRAARPDRGWITGLTADWERRPELLRHLRVMANNLCFPRGGRLVLPYAPDNGSDADGGAPGGGPDAVREVSVRYTDAVRAVWEQTRVPVRYADLAQRLAGLFPHGADGAIDGLLRQLVEKELLLSELRPPLDAVDPLGHLLSVLDRIPPEVLADTLPEYGQLRAVEQALARYSDCLIGEGGAAWESVTSAMRQLRDAKLLVHVDLALDVEVTLPDRVAAEAERAADLLWRLAPQAPPENSPLARYHEEFVERYGREQAVPVLELLDPEAGLGAPAGYRQPPGHRPDPPAPHRETERDMLLLQYAQEVLMAGESELVLTDDHPLVTRLSRRRAEDGAPPPAALELFTRLLAESTDALEVGDFQLLVERGSAPAGATFGRFAYLLPEQDRAALDRLVRPEHRPESAPLRAQLSFQARHARGANVAQVPRMLAHQIPAGVFADGEPAAEGDTSAVLHLDDLGVMADHRRLRIVRLCDGREVEPTVFHRLNTSAHGPNVARFLSEVPRFGVRSWRPWTWSAAEDLPHTPRVRYGRCVLVPARWRPTEELLDQDIPFEAWADGVQAWRARWRVPERVCLTYHDQRLELTLTCEPHLRLLRHELGRRPQAQIFEAPESAPSATGWLSGPEEAHRNELIFPLLARPDAVTARTAAPEEDPVRTAPQPHPAARHRPLPCRAEREHLPGGEWLYALVYCGPERHDELIAGHLPRLLAALPADVDRWFFLRYRDREGGPHLRLRFHGEPRTLAAHVLPGLNRWAGDLRDTGLIRDVSLRAYAPELARYGGPQAIEAAESVFAADSRAVIETFALRGSGRLTLEPVLLCAAGCLDMARAFFGTYDGSRAYDGGPAYAEDWQDWLLHTFPKGEQHKEFQQRRREAVGLLDPYGDWAELRSRPGGAELLSVWERRRGALADYRRSLDGPGPKAWTPAERVVPSLFHMHHNRLIGIDQDAERASLALVRGAVQAHRDRRRKGSP